MRLYRETQFCCLGPADAQQQLHHRVWLTKGHCLQSSDRVRTGALVRPALAGAAGARVDDQVSVTLGGAVELDGAS